MGGTDNMEQARAYFAQAAKLNSDNIRALYGWFLSSSYLYVSSSKGAKDKQSNLKYAEWALNQIQSKYQSQQSDSRLKDTKVIESLKRHLESLQNP